VRVLFFFVVSGLAHLLAARWFLSTLSPASRARHRRLVYGIAFGLAALLVAARTLSRLFETQATHDLMGVFMLELGAVVISLLPIGVMTLLARIISRLFQSKASPSNLVPVPDLVSRRQAVERLAGLSLLTSTSLALGWGMVRGRHAFALEEVVVRIKGWPRALEGYTIAQVSDVHVGTFVGDRELDEGFELVKKIRPDLLVATGDLVDFESSVVGALSRRLTDVAARDGAHAILGNHDHYAGAADVVRRLRSAGVLVLDNESRIIRPGDGGGFALLGVDDLQGRRGHEPGFNGPDLGAAARGIGADVPRILLAHQPRYFVESAGRVALQLSGHTHGGQINPGFRPADLFMEFVAGRYERSGSTLWVNRGFGVAGPPSRVGAPPEITKIVLVAA
jgi:predicted MPP superfamily phosphohydrolase